MAITRTVVAEMADTPTARPSSPSIRFTELVIATIHSTVMGTESMGLFCCSQVTRRCRKDETALRVTDCLFQMSRVFVLLIVPLLLVAALMESYVTPLIASYFN